MIFLLVGLVIFSIVSFISWIIWKLSTHNVIRLPPEWLESDTDIEVIGCNKTKIECTKSKPWDGKTLPVLHVDADFIDDNNLLKCPNCGHIWSIGPDV